MHINFFGDVVLFTGWSLLTRSRWALGLPLLMLVLLSDMERSSKPDGKIRSD